MDFVEHNWTRSDEGIWEVRGGPRHFTHSKLMAWVAADRAVKAVEQFGLDGPLPRWQQLREEICRDILTKGTTSSDTRSPSTTGRASWTRRC